MIDPHVALCRHRRFGMQGDARPGPTEHAQIVRTVSHGNHLFFPDTQPRGDLFKRLDLGLLSKDGLRHFTGQPVSRRQQRVCAVFIKTKLLRHPRR